jgi:hypothetical protein
LCKLFRDFKYIYITFYQYTLYWPVFTLISAIMVVTLWYMYFVFTFYVVLEKKTTIWYLVKRQFFFKVMTSTDIWYFFYNILRNYKIYTRRYYVNNELIVRNNVFNHYWNRNPSPWLHTIFICWWNSVINLYHNMNCIQELSNKYLLFV